MRMLKFALVFICVSCSKEIIEVRYDFPKEIIPYVEKFLLEGKNRGIKIDLNGLKIFYQDSLPLNQYQGYYDSKKHSIYIKKSTKSWMIFNEFPEEVMMHELGHGILKRDHLYDTFDNGDYKSVMATPYVGWSKHLEKEKYYYDELFDKSKFNTLK